MPLLPSALLLLAALPASAEPSCSPQGLRELTAGCENLRQGNCSMMMSSVLYRCDDEHSRLVRELQRVSPAEFPALRDRVRAFDVNMAALHAEEVAILQSEARMLGLALPDVRGLQKGYPDLAQHLEVAQRRVGAAGAGEPAKPAVLTAPPASRTQIEGLQQQAAAAGDGRTLAAIAAEHAARGREEEARRASDLARRSGYDGVEPDLVDASLALKAGRRDEALAAVERALAADPSDKRARALRSFILGRTGEMKGAAKLPDLGGLGPERELGAGERAARRGGPGGADALPGGDAAGAAAFAAGGPRPDPGGASPVPSNPYQLLLAAARRKLGVGDLTGALFDCTRAISADPGDAEALKLRAHVNNRLGQHDAALRDAEEALKRSPGDVAARLERVYALIGLGRHAEALAEADAVLKEAPGSALAHLYRGMALLKLGRAAEGEAALDEAVRLDPSLRALADPLRSKKAAPAPQRRVDPRKGLWVLCGLMALLLLLEGLKRVFKPGWRTTAPRPQTEAPVPTGTLPPGTMLGGNYRVERELARGGMGVVYRAQDLTLRRPVAIKQMRTGLPEIERFLREARLAAKLRHQNLAQIFSVIDAGQPFLVFELVEGEALDALLKRRGPLTLEEAVALLSPLAAALDYAHAQKVIHRDLKPANVMLSSDGVPKLMDFGIAHEARAAYGETRTEAWGTPPYMAPEQESGVVSRQSDLYALAVMAYELLTGRLPFSGMADKLGRKFVRPPDPKLAAAFEKAFDPLPAGRPESAAAFLASLRACLPAR